MPTYKNGNYFVTILSDGTKIRRTNDDEFIPAFAENCDVKITDRCTIGCPFCYEGCAATGKHGNLFKYKNMLDSLHPYTELALNGNDMDHPDLDKFLEYLKERKIYANITVSVKQFITNIDKLRYYTDNKLVYGVGISWNADYVYKLSNEEIDELIKNIQSFQNAVIHTINGIFSQLDRELLRNKDLKVLVLGYKNLQRGVSYFSKHESDVRLKMACLKNDMKKIIDEGWFKVISFDNLALSQLDIKQHLSDDDWDEFYMGDDGGYTFYIDLVKGEFAKNSISNDRYPIGDKTIDEMFMYIKEHTK